MGPNITVTRKDIVKTPELLKFLRQAEGSGVLVGIPQERTQRRGAKINNASLMYIQTHGSPIRGIPRRPVIEPAIALRRNRVRIEAQLSQAASAYLQGKPTQARAFLERAGMIGMNASKAYFTDPGNGWPPLKAETIKRKGSSRPLIDTAQLRQSITYVVQSA